MRKEQQDKPQSNLNVNSYDLLKILEGVETIYIYPHHEIKMIDNMFAQTRSGPNWEGGVLTMATCKHLLRTYKTIEAKKTAFCGVTNKLDGENYIMYVGVIDKTFGSNFDLNCYLSKHHPEAIKAKLSTDNRLGDIFLPVTQLTGDDKYDSMNFEEPCDDHCRKEENDSKGDAKWFKDIEYVTRNGTRPKCLIFNPATVHTKPVYTWEGKLGRSGIVIKGEDAPEQFIKLVDEAL